MRMERLGKKTKKRGEMKGKKMQRGEDLRTTT